MAQFISIKITGIERLITGFENLPRQMEAETSAVARNAWNIVATELENYPPGPSGSKYKRTGKLGHGWEAATVNVATVGSTGVGDLFELTATNELAIYWPYVQASGVQAHQNHHWKTDEAILTEKQPQIEELFVRAVTRVLHRL